MKIYRILGKRGRITIPYAIRQRVGFSRDDILSFSESADGKAVVVRREKICDECSAAYSRPDSKAALLDFLQKRCGMGEWEAFFAMIDLIRHIQIESLRTNQIVPDLDAIGIRLQTERDANQFMAVFQSFCNGMRMMCNRGYTPDELSQIQPPPKPAQ